MQPQILGHPKKIMKSVINWKDKLMRFFSCIQRTITWLCYFSSKEQMCTISILCTPCTGWQYKYAGTCNLYPMYSLYWLGVQVCWHMQPPRDIKAYHIPLVFSKEKTRTHGGVTNICHTKLPHQSIKKQYARKFGGSL